LKRQIACHKINSAPFSILNQEFAMSSYALLALMAASFVAPDDRNADAIKKDYERLSGRWRLVSAIEDGKEVPADEVKKTELITKGDTFTILGDSKLGTSPSGTFKIDPSKTPKTVDSLQGKGPNKGETILGIYEIIDDNNKRACWAPPGKPRPTDFTSKPGSGHLLQVWKRERP
jgi:uncharacterized protein (TIGR03067 family)